MDGYGTWRYLKLHWMEWFPCSLHVVQHCALLMNESLLTVRKTIKLLCDNAFKVVLSACSFWVPRPCESYVSVGLLFCCPISVVILDRTDQHYLFEISTMDSSIVGESHHFCGGWKELRTNFSLSIDTVFPLLFLKIRPWQPLTFIGKKFAPNLLILRKYPVFVLKPVCCLKPTVRPCDSSSCFLIQIRLPHVCSYTVNSPFVA